MNQSDILKMREDMMTDQRYEEDRAEDQRHDEIVKHFNDLETYDTVSEKFSEFGSTNDPVNNPHHYMGAGIEAIDVIHAFTPDPYSYYMGNVIKYVLRHMEKGNEKQDLEKARWYLNKMIEEWNA